MKSRKKSFTLLEVLIAISLVLLASGAMGWKVHAMIDKKRFSSNVERLRDRLLTCRRLALNTQSDWQGEIRRVGNRCTYEAASAEMVESIVTSNFQGITIFFEGEKRELLSLYFTSTGEIFPKGLLRIQTKEDLFVEWKFPDIFFLEEGKSFGPLHPDDAT